VLYSSLFFGIFTLMKQVLSRIDVAERG
jgi:hypothetical protein